jgi:hypothetical protein
VAAEQLQQLLVEIAARFWGWKVPAGFYTRTGHENKARMVEVLAKLTRQISASPSFRMCVRTEFLGGTVGRESPNYDPRDGT